MLSAAFGARQGPWLRRRARFEGSSDVEPVREAVSESRETTFDFDITDPARLESILGELSERLCDGLRRNDRRGRTIRIKVRLADFTTVTRARTIPAPTDEVAVIGGVALELLREYAPPGPVRLLGVGVTGFGTDEAQPCDDQMALPV